MITLQHDQQALNGSITFFKESAPATETAMAILREVMKYRRIAGPATCCPDGSCPTCVAPHLPKILEKIAQQQPVTFILPAFPGKAPNLSKVLGTLPDMAERCAVEFIQQLCERIRRIYAPGAHFILASDGRVFSDVVGMRDEDVSDYRDALLDMVNEAGLKNITAFNLEDLYKDFSFDAMRAQMMDDFGDALEDLRASVRRGAEAESSADDRETNRLYCGITRFLVEDATFPGQTMSRNQIQKDARARAYQVIQRSQAWSGVVERHFPEAVRLSIHPHAAGAKKLGIQLVEPAETDLWMTPWHGVALEVTEGRFVLTKRAQAEAMGARLVTENGRPSHFTLVG